MPESRIELMDPGKYLAGLIARVGDRNPLDVLEQTPSLIGELVRSAPPEVLKRRPFAGKWTPVEVVGHLVDTEFTFGYRIRTIYCDDEPQIIGMDQDKWAAAQKHAERDPLEIAGDFAAMRKINIRFYRSIPKSAYDKVGIHSERGREKLGHMIHYIAGHDLSHIDQLTQYIAAAKASS